ncbi:MAG: hypothetical protein GVY04_05040 [Cyanobacteria bacterium]|jgi:hypothetical protein|nr:hypothetical protein [Cyanobacteria bacterium GSL.Bin1]
MAYEFSEKELADINEKLPPQYAALKDKYPVSIANAADDWDTPPYPEGYVPQSIDIYYQEHDALGPGLTIEDGKIGSIQFNNWVNDSDVIGVEIDSSWAYIQVEGRVILNRIGGAVLPNVLQSPELLLKATIAKIQR